MTYDAIVSNFFSYMRRLMFYLRITLELLIASEYLVGISDFLIFQKLIIKKLENDRFKRT